MLFDLWFASIALLFVLHVLYLQTVLPVVCCLIVLPVLQGGGGLASLLGPERMAALLPKLYRLTHDPSPKVGV
jgi:hypothetical protein